MTARFFSTRSRPVHMGPYPAEHLQRTEAAPGAAAIPPMTALQFDRPDDPRSIVMAMRDYMATLDAIREGPVNPAKAEVPDDPRARAEHLKAFGHFCDAALVGCCAVTPADRLERPIRNPDIARLSEDIRTRQTKTLASGIDLIMADLKEAMETPPGPIDGQDHCIVLLYENPREPRADESGTRWIRGASAHRAALLAAETAVVIAQYLRHLGYAARAHSAATSDLDLNRLAVAAGLLQVTADQHRFRAVPR